MVCISAELKGIEIKLVFGSVFRPQISRVLDMGLKGGKTWTRFPNIQIYSNRETEAFISCQQVHTAKRRVQFRICHKFIEIFILLLSALHKMHLLQPTEENAQNWGIKLTLGNIKARIGS